MANLIHNVVGSDRQETGNVYARFLQSLCSPCITGVADMKLPLCMIKQAMNMQPFPGCKRSAPGVPFECFTDVCQHAFQSGAGYKDFCDLDLRVMLLRINRHPCNVQH